ncbi:MAG: hypothetical protein ACM3W7_12630, partial [Acidobacteriota bacterium]
MPRSGTIWRLFPGLSASAQIAIGLRITTCSWTNGGEFSPISARLSHEYSKHPGDFEGLSDQEFHGPGTTPMLFSRFVKNCR